MIDATGEFMGEKNIDAKHTLNVVHDSLSFSGKYLKKGGTLLFRSLDTSKVQHFEVNMDSYEGKSKFFIPLSH